MFEGSAVDVVVGWVTVHELVKEESVEWHSPVCWTWEEGMVVPDAEVIRRVCGSLVLVEVVVCVLFIEPQGC